MSANESLESLGALRGLSVAGESCRSNLPHSWGALGWAKAPRGPQERTGGHHGEADRHAANVLPIIREAQKAGATTLREIAAAAV